MFIPDKFRPWDIIDYDCVLFPLILSDLVFWFFTTVLWFLINDNGYLIIWLHLVYSLQQFAEIWC